MFALAAIGGFVVGAASARLYGRRNVGRLSHPDLLTGVGTRRDGQRVLAGLQSGDAVVMLDVDRLKAVNDERGHAAGDAELVALAQHLSAGVRTGDAVFRWGGDEFVLVLRAGGAGAAGVIDRLRSASPTSFSAGVAIFRGGTGADTLVAADEALLRAKRAGGSRVVTA